MDSIPRFDTLGVYTKSLFVRQSLQDDEELFYSCDLSKYNRYGFQQDRILLITNRHIFTMDFGPYNYNIHRKVQVNCIDAFTQSKVPQTNELVVHFMGDYDERYEAGDHLRNISCILKHLLEKLGKTYKQYEVPDKKLRKYNTTKKDAKKGKYIRPDIKWLVPSMTDEKFKFDLVTTHYRPTMNIANDFSEGRLATEDKVGEEQASDEEGKSYEIQEDPDTAFFNTQTAADQQAESSGSANQQTNGDGTTGGDVNRLGITNQLSTEKQAEVDQLRSKMASQKEENKQDEEQKENFKIMKHELGIERTLKKKKTELFKQENVDTLWTPNELTPIQEDIPITEDFQPSSFQVLSADEVAAIEVFGKNKQGFTLAQLADETGCLIVPVTLHMQVIEKMNESPYVCKVIAVVETSPDDPKIATKVAVTSPLADENCSPTLDFMDKFLVNVTKNQNWDGRKVFRAVAEALLDLRLRLPPFYNFRPGNILVDPNSLEVKIVVTQDLFKKETNILNLSRDDLLFEAKFGFNPFKTHLKTKVTEKFIMFYPVMFPEDEEPPTESFSSLIHSLLIKDPLQRLGSDTFEKELLDHAYFQEQD